MEWREEFSLRQREMTGRDLPQKCFGATVVIRLSLLNRIIRTGHAQQSNTVRVGPLKTTSEHYLYPVVPT